MRRTDRRTDLQTDGQTKATLIAPFPTERGHNNEKKQQNKIFRYTASEVAHNKTVQFNNVSKSAPTLASCYFNKHGLIFIIFGKQHQHTSENDMLIQLSLCLHFYLLYLHLTSCDRNEAFWRHSMFVKQSSSFSRKNLIFISPDLCSPNSPVDSKPRLTTEFGD